MASDELSPDMILGYIRDIHLLYADFQLIRRDFERVWEMRAYRNGIESCLSCFDRAGVQMFKAVKWLAEQRINLIRNGGQILDLEMHVESLIKRFVRLELNYVKLWMDIAKPSEIEISMAYFAHIIERLDYLRDWLSIQREGLLKGTRPDYAFDTYEDAGYTTIPTY